MNKSAKIELLAPAKDKETAFSAINAGADAVYIGFLKFGARKQAGNTLEDLKQIVEYAHIYRACVYVTLNTIYTNDEIEEVVKTINDLYLIGVDAIIIQDMGILNFELPPIRIFASTQCHNNTLEKIKFLEKIGIERVILPREFSIYDIQNIKNNTEIDLESFVHGALCVSYSGQCYLSLANGGRSANRGECAQPCRKKYSLVSKDGKTIAKDKYLLSLKDLNLSNHLKELIQSGITSFKIEGRLKDEIYVKNTVSFYRQKIDEILKELNLEKSSIGNSYTDFIPDIKKSFNRGYTDFFIDGKRKNFCTIDYAKSIGEQIGHIKSIEKNCFTLDRNKLNNGDGICFFDVQNELSGTQIQKVEGTKIYPQSMNNVKKGMKIYRNLNKEFNTKVSKNNIERKIEIKADISINKNSIVLQLSDSENNTAIEIFKQEFEKKEQNSDTMDYIKKYIKRTGNTEFEISDIKIQNDTDRYIPPSILNEIRRNAIEKLRIQRKNNFQQKMRETTIKTSQYPEKELNYSSNISNNQAEEFYNKCGTKIIEKAAELLPDLSEKTLMTTKHCIKYSLGLCKKNFSDTKIYKEPLYLIDEKNKKYELKFNCKECIMLIENHS